MALPRLRCHCQAHVGGKRREYNKRAAHLECPQQPPRGRGGYAISPTVLVSGGSRPRLHRDAHGGIVKLTQKIARQCSKERTIEDFGLSRALYFRYSHPFGFPQG